MTEYNIGFVFTSKEDFEDFMKCIEAPENLDVEYYDSGSKRYYFQNIRIGDLECFASILPPERSGSTPSTNLVRQLHSDIDHFPSLIINIGVASSCDLDFGLTDVLIASKLIEYDSNSVYKNNTILPSSSSTESKNKKSKYFIDFKTEQKNKYEQWKNKSRDKLKFDSENNLQSDFSDLTVDPKVRIGKLATGSLVNQSNSLTESVENSVDKDVKAFDTEGATIGRTLPNNVDYICVRAISNYGPIQNKDNYDIPPQDELQSSDRNWREHAIRNATRYVLKVLRSNRMKYMIDESKNKDISGFEPQTMEDLRTRLYFINCSQSNGTQLDQSDSRQIMFGPPKLTGSHDGSVDNLGSYKMDDTNITISDLLKHSENRLESEIEDITQDIDSIIRAMMDDEEQTIERLRRVYHRIHRFNFSNSRHKSEKAPVVLKTYLSESDQEPKINMIVSNYCEYPIDLELQLESRTLNFSEDKSLDVYFDGQPSLKKELEIAGSDFSEIGFPFDIKNSGFESDLDLKSKIPEIPQWTWSGRFNINIRFIDNSYQLINANGSSIFEKTMDIPSCGAIFSNFSTNELNNQVLYFLFDLLDIEDLNYRDIRQILVGSGFTKKHILYAVSSLNAKPVERFVSGEKLDKLTNSCIENY